jgi:predicted TIM-barrel fold metal-dependent hydrolase
MSLSMLAAEKAKPNTRLSVVDCDIHPVLRSDLEILPYLPERWRDHLKTYRRHLRQGLHGTLTHMRMQVNRLDAVTPDGGPPGSDVDFMRSHHLDQNGVEWGLLQSLQPAAHAERNLEYGAALATANNEWQIAQWIDKEPRLRGSIQVTQENPEAAVREIKRRAGDKRFVQVSMSPRAQEPLGRPRYWPIYEACEEHGLPIGLHVPGFGSGYASTPAGWPSFYLEEHQTFAYIIMGVFTSMVLEGVFERYKGLKLVLVEGGFAWVPALCWRLDKAWTRMRSEVPHLKRPPSEYIREHIWFTTQPIEEPENPEDLNRVIEWIGWDRLLFSTDYPHWDFDDPKTVFNIRMTPEHRKMIFSDNAKRVYGLP